MVLFRQNRKEDIIPNCKRRKEKMIIRAITTNPNGYKIYFDNGKVLILSFKDDYYQGHSAWNDYWGINDSDVEIGEILGEKIINYHTLPAIIKSHVEKILEEIDSG
jgi:hypothetical protein